MSNETKKGFRDVKVFYEGELQQHSERSEGNEIKEIKIIADGVDLIDKAHAEGKEEFINSDCDLKTVMLEVKEAGRQSALAEIEKLKKEIENSRAYERDLEAGHGRLTKKLRDFEAEKQEQVRNLIWLLENDSSITFYDAIKRSFPDCAEQPKEETGAVELIKKMTQPK